MQERPLTPEIDRVPATGYLRVTLLAVGELAHLATVYRDNVNGGSGFAPDRDQAIAQIQPPTATVSGCPPATEMPGNTTPASAATSYRWFRHSHLPLPIPPGHQPQPQHILWTRTCGAPV